MTIHDYETWGAYEAGVVLEPEPLEEAYKGSSIVTWWGNIERQISSMIEKYEAARNSAYVEKLREFLAIWREYRADGTLNREMIDPVEAASRPLAVDNWRLSNYFSVLRDQLRKLVSVVAVELPMEEPRGGGGGGRGAAMSPPSGPPSDFGPEENPPSGETVADELGAEEAEVGAPEGEGGPPGEAPPEGVEPETGGQELPPLT